MSSSGAQLGAAFVSERWLERSSSARCGAGVDMAGLTIHPAPPSHRHDDLADWLRMVAKGATQLVQEAACDPDADAALSTATAWLATDLGAICEAMADYLAEGKLELFEDEHSE